MLRRLFLILSMMAALVGFTALGNAQQTGLGGQIGFSGSFTYDDNSSPTMFTSFDGVTVASTPVPTGSFAGLQGQSATFTPFSFSDSCITPLWSVTSGSNSYYLDANIASADLTLLPSVVSFTGNGTLFWGNNGNIESSAASWSLSVNSNNNFNLLISTTNVPVQGNPPSPFPSFGAEIFSYGVYSTNSPPGTCPITGNVAVGQRIVVIAMEDGTDRNISGVTDSQGNSYTPVIYYNNTNFSPGNQIIWSAYATSALTAGADTINITWSSQMAGWNAYAISIVTLNNTQPAGQPDSTAENNAYGYAFFNNGVSVPGTTVAANTVSVGLVAANNFPWTIGSGTIYDNMQRNIHYEFFYHVNTSAGPYDPGGTGSLYNTYSGIWAAFK